MAALEDEEEVEASVILTKLLLNAITAISLGTFIMNVQRRSLTQKQTTWKIMKKCC